MMHIAAVESVWRQAENVIPWLCLRSVVNHVSVVLVTLWNCSWRNIALSVECVVEVRYRNKK